jgi:nicotinamidase-related amidase
MLKKNQAVLVVVDVQGKLAQLMANKERLFGSLENVIKGFNLLGLPTIWLEQVPDKLGSTIPEVANLLPEISPISKTSFGCMGSDKFKLALEKTGRKNVVLVGIEAHICVYQSAAQLLEEGYDVTVISEAVSSRTLENCQIGIDRMVQLGASISSVEMVLFELLQTAEAKQFREIAALVK